jgi:hypothetical protein
MSAVDNHHHVTKAALRFRSYPGGGFGSATTLLALRIVEMCKVKD